MRVICTQIESDLSPMRVICPQIESDLSSDSSSGGFRVRAAELHEVWGLSVGLKSRLGCAVKLDKDNWLTSHFRFHHQNYMNSQGVGSGAYMAIHDCGAVAIATTWSSPRRAKRDPIAFLDVSCQFR